MEKQENNNKSLIEIRREYTFAQNIVSSIVYGICAMLFIAGMVILIVYSAINKNVNSIVSSCIYGSSMILMYIMLVLYHCISTKKTNRVFKILSHDSVFFAILGTYMPYLLIRLNGAFGWTIFGIITAFSVIGIVFTSVNIEKFKKINVIYCLIMGLASIFLIKKLYQIIDIRGIILFIISGILYIIATVFYCLKRYRFSQYVWISLTTISNILQYFIILLYIIN